METMEEQMIHNYNIWGQVPVSLHISCGTTSELPTFSRALFAQLQNGDDNAYLKELIKK